LRSHPCCSERTNELVFFVVTGVQHDVISSHLDAFSRDIYVGSTIGELGCWVDTTITRILQTGVEHSRVPNISAYMGIGERHQSAGHHICVIFISRLDTGSPTRPPSIIDDPSVMPGHRSAFRKILSLISATLTSHAVDYNLDVSVLFKGARGTGKFTVLNWVAQHFGIHILEVIGLIILVSVELIL
jgi:peroxin-6